jgi:hypothetical protein
MKEAALTFDIVRISLKKLSFFYFLFTVYITFFFWVVKFFFPVGLGGPGKKTKPCLWGNCGSSEVLKF